MRNTKLKGLIPFVPLALALLLSWPNLSRATLTVSSTGLQGDTNFTLDTNGTLGLGIASAAAITIGQSSLNVSIPGSLTVSSATTTVNNLHVTGSCLGCGVSSGITAINGLSNATTSLVAGTNITIATSSPNIITISASAVSAPPAGSNTQLQFNTSGAFGASPNLTWLSPALTIGQTGTTTGQLKLAGAASGTVTVQASSTAGSWTLTLPSSAGTAGYVLSTDGSGNTSWIAQSGMSSIVVNGLTNSSFQFNGTANQITVATSSSNTLTWSLPQNINTTSAPSFAGLTLTGNATTSGNLTVLGALFDAAGYRYSTSTSAGVLSLDSLTGVLIATGTPNQITVASTTGQLVFSLPQDINTNSTPSFAGLMLTGNATTSGNLTVLGALFDAAGNRYATSTSGVTIPSVTNLLAGNGGGGVSDSGISSTTIPHWVKYTVPYTSLTAAALTQAVTLFTLPANSKITAMTMKHSTAFAGPSVTAVTVSIGGAGTATDFSNAFDIYQAVSNTAYLDNGGNTSGTTMASQTVSANFTAVGANFGNGTVTNLTAGSFTVWVMWSSLP
ncbi:MAG: hypothetical protein ABSH47_21680 [Bryobacteraceae bacterium]|jgi:hypothetical protein